MAYHTDLSTIVLSNTYPGNQFFIHKLCLISTLINFFNSHNTLITANLVYVMILTRSNLMDLLHGRLANILNYLSALNLHLIKLYHRVCPSNPSSLVVQ